MLTVDDIRQYFIQELRDENFTVDRTNSKTIELIGASFIADEKAIFGEPNVSYIDAELDWYLGCSTNINDIRYKDEPPTAWQYAANKYGEINSNYGKLIFDDKYYRQFDNVINELNHEPDSRRAVMIYNRPSIWTEFDENGKNDFICTNAVSYYIRDGHLQSVVQMRSNDVVFGYKNDYAWQLYVLEQMVKDYNDCKEDGTPELKVGDIIWQVQNLHVYERHFHLVK